MTTTSGQSIAEQMDEHKQTLTQLGIPADVRAAVDSDLDRLRTGGIPTSAATPGTALPDGNLLDPSGTPTTLDRERAGRAAVIVFYRGAWCPACNITLRTYQTDLVPELDARGVRLIAISPQKPDGSMTDVQERQLTFTVLADPGNSVAAQLGILMQPSDEVLAIGRAFGQNLTELNGDGTATLPMPTVVVVDGDGVIRFIDIHPDFTTRTEVADILDAVDALTI